MFETASSKGHPSFGDFVWSRLGNPQLTPGQIADKGRRSLRRMTEWDVPIPTDCRLWRAVKYIELAAAADDVRRLSDRERHVVSEAARSVFEFYVATHSSAEVPSDEVKAKFQEAILGCDLPSDEPAHPARNTQFELYVWGMFRASGVVCEFKEPPDLYCMYGHQPLGIAVKRIWSQEQAKRRLSEACAQIDRSGIPGLVAVNAQEYLTPGSAVSDLGEKGQAFNDALARIHGHLPYLARKDHVLGLLVAGATYRNDLPRRGPVAFDISVFHQLFLMTETPEDEQLAQSFGSAQQVGFSKWCRENL